MIKVEYTLPKDELCREYKDAMAHHIAPYEGAWRAHRAFLESHTGSTGLFPSEMSELLVLDFDKLSEIYEQYLYLRGQEIIDDNRHAELKAMFPYSADNIQDALQPYVAKFFMNNQNGYQIHTCHYCDTAYVNVYDPLAGFSSVLDLVNNATPEELPSLVRTSSGACISERVAKSIIRHRRYRSESEFNQLGCWHGSGNKCDAIRKELMNHFDLDHVLPKAECPIVGLSLFNFVPSCQVCNEKLKKKKCLGDNTTQRIKLSPTSDQYDFSQQVSIALRRKDGGVPKFNCMQHQNEYRLVFEYKDKDYAVSVNMFRLTERYNYHKVEALRLHDLLSDYSGYISMLHLLFEDNGLGDIFTEDKIREDLFGEKYYKTYHRCFGKLHSDIVKAFRANGTFR